MDVPAYLVSSLQDPAPIERAAAAIGWFLAGGAEGAVRVMAEVLRAPLPDDGRDGQGFVPQCSTAHGAILEFACQQGVPGLDAAARTLWDELRDGERAWNPAVAARALELLARSGDEGAQGCLLDVMNLPVALVPLPVAGPDPAQGWLARLLSGGEGVRPLPEADEDRTPVMVAATADARVRAAASFCAARALLRLGDESVQDAVEQRLCQVPLELAHLLSRDDGEGHGALWFMAAAACWEQITPLAPTFARVANQDGAVLRAACTAASGVLGNVEAGVAALATLRGGPSTVRGEEPAARLATAQVLSLSRRPEHLAAARSFLETCAALAPEDGDADDPAWLLAGDARDLLRYHRVPFADPVLEAVSRVREGRPTDLVRWSY